MSLPRRGDELPLQTPTPTPSAAAGPRRPAALHVSAPTAYECAACALGRASQPAACPFHDLARPAGTVLLRQGEPPGSVWFLREGAVLLTSSTEEGDELFCTVRGPGSLLGLEALRDRPSDAHAWALSDVVVCRLSTEAFRGWVGDRRSPIGAVLELALDEASHRREERVALRGRSVQRVARFLVERRRALGDRGGDRPLDVEHQVLARMLGMRAETLSRALARLREAGALGGGREVEVIDAACLERLAG